MEKETKPCMYCSGTGKIKDDFATITYSFLILENFYTNSSPVEAFKMCPACWGTGKIKP